MKSPIELDPLIGMDDPSKPLRSKVLAVPKYREQYLRNVRKLAKESLDWDSVGDFVTAQAALVDDAIKNETRKLGTYEAFLKATSGTVGKVADEQPSRGHGAMNLRAFCEARRKYLLEYKPPKPAR